MWLYAKHHGSKIFDRQGRGFSQGFSQGIFPRPQNILPQKGTNLFVNGFLSHVMGEKKRAFPRL
jgi:hypothetical protein